MKKILLGLVLCSALTLSACSEDKGETLASTEAGKIYSSELYEEMKARYGNQTLQSMLIKDILENRYGDQVSEEDVDALLQENIDAAGGEEQFEMYLTAQNQTMDTMKESTRLSLLIAEAVKEHDGFTEEDLQAKYDEWTPEVTTSHILVEDKETADEVLKKLEDGGDFKALVEEYSTDTASARNGGQVKFAPGTDKVVKEYETAAMDLAEGEYTKEPVESAYGFHIIRMDEKPEKGSFEEEKDKVERDYVENLMADQNKIREAINMVAEESNIIIEDEELSGALSGLLNVNGDESSQSESGSESEPDEGTDGADDSTEEADQEEASEEESSEADSSEADSQE